MASMYAGVDLGGTNIKCAFGDHSGALKYQTSVPTESHAGPESVLKRIARTVKELSALAGCRPKALGIGLPALLDLEEGITKFMPNFPTNWRDVRVRDILAPEVGCPVYVLNDVRAAALGELTYGHGKGVSTLVFFSLGTGIGGGIAVDGKLRLGPFGAAGEIGHQTILPDGPLCGCGNRGCLEALASGPALVGAGVRLLRSGLAPALHRITAGEISRVTPETMAQAASSDQTVRDAIVQAGQYLGIGVANMITALHPDIVVIGGGVANIGELLFETVRETVLERVGMFPPNGIPIQPSLLGENAGTLGGIALAVKGGLSPH